MSIQNVQLRSLKPHGDARGELIEIYRDSWFSEHPVQWNLVRSEKGILRGVHGHFRHTDHLLVLEGSVAVGLRDMRPDSPTHGRAELVPLDGRNPQMLMIPAGVAHGFYFETAATHIYAVTHYWDTEDELGCQWNDAALGIDWRCDSPLISPRDASLPAFEIFREHMETRLAAAIPR